MTEKKASGRNVAEDERGTVRCTLRLEEDYLDELDVIAEQLGLTRSGTVAWLIDRYRSGVTS